LLFHPSHPGREEIVGLHPNFFERAPQRFGLLVKLRQIPDTRELSEQLHGCLGCLKGLDRAFQMRAVFFHFSFTRQGHVFDPHAS
jgi:hypothetical protein